MAMKSFLASILMVLMVAGCQAIQNAGRWLDDPTNLDTTGRIVDMVAYEATTRYHGSAAPNIEECENILAAIVVSRIAIDGGVVSTIEAIDAALSALPEALYVKIRPAVDTVKIYARDSLGDARLNHLMHSLLNGVERATDQYLAFLKARAAIDAARMQPVPEKSGPGMNEG